MCEVKHIREQLLSENDRLKDVFGYSGISVLASVKSVT